MTIRSPPLQKRSTVSNVIQAIETAVDYGQFPDPAGHFGPYGGRFVPELLIAPLEELSAAYARYRDDAEFRAQLDSDLKYYVGRPTPLYLAERWSNNVGGARIYLKREDLDHTGAHKINNTMGQALLAVRMGKKRIVAETGAGQHGVATAAVCARLGLECIVYMGAEDVRRQSVNVYRMRLMGAKVVPVDSGTRTLKDALNEAFRDWAANVDSTFYIIGTVAGPHPYPEMVRDFQSVIGRETREQCLAEHGRLPDAVVACVGGGSNAIGIFHPFLEDREVAIYGVEAGGDGVETGRHAAPLSAGRPGVLHGNRTYLMENEDGQIMPTHSVSAGLDYPGVGPEHAWLKDGGRVNYIAVNDDAALAAFHSLAQTEGIIPALETAHAIAYAEDLAREMRPDQTIVVNCSGRGDKDINTVAEVEGMTL
ncbi:MAG: tryptophan synthase subunit beta [Spiribacter salinus]|uniref:Tryptophan synthase beta chain n=1 Tax=Spiribacter salinus TaxID=1335746 RepID=A0A540VVM6_9GAMM|nr:MAG: tryptophan synthase subunit beta [Spiribacter salinus]